MATNPFFDNEGTATAQAMYEDLIIQAIQVCGNDMYYIPRAAGSVVDEILGEEIATSFSSSYLLEMYVENAEGFEGQDLFQKFGVEIRDDCTFVIARKRWAEEIGNVENLIRPREGDLVYAPFAKALFEINEVVHEDPFYQIGHLPVYKLYCSLYRYNDERLDIGETGFIGSNFSGNMALTVANADEFAIGEDVAQLVGTVTVTGKIANIIDDQLIVGNISSPTASVIMFTNGPIEGLASLAEGVVTAAAPYDPIYGRNQQIEDEADLFTEFDPANPFGDF